MPEPAIASIWLRHHISHFAAARGQNHGLLPTCQGCIFFNESLLAAGLGARAESRRRFGQVGVVLCACHSAANAGTPSCGNSKRSKMW